PARRVGSARRRGCTAGGGGAVALGPAASLAAAAAGPPLFPIVYLLVALLVSGLPRRSALALLAVAIALDGAAALGRSEPLSSFAAHVVFLLLFAALYHAVLSTRLAAARKAERGGVTRRTKQREHPPRTFPLTQPRTPH